MNYTTHKQKLVISICLLNAEKDNIKIRVGGGFLSIDEFLD